MGFEIIVLTIDIETDQIPEIFVRFENVINERYWLKRCNSVRDEIRGRFFLKEHLEEENAIALALARCSDLVKRYGRIPTQETRNHSIYPAISFAAQILSIMKHSTDVEVDKLIQRIRGAFKNPADMRAIQFELMMATHFVRRGHLVVWPEMEGTGTFDLLIKDIGIKGLEVECKSISADKGRKIHRREALEFHHLVKPSLQNVSRSLQKGIAVVLTLNGRLPSLYRQRLHLAKQVTKSCLTAQNIRLTDGSDIRISDFDMTTLNVAETKEGMVIQREAIDIVTQTTNRESMILGNKNGVIIFVIQSRQDDTMLKYVFDTVSDSAKTQLSKTRPGLFLIGMHELNTESLLHIAKQDYDPSQSPTALRIAVTSFLKNLNRDHVVGVGFISSAALGLERNGVIRSGGTAYVFPKRESSFWHQDFSGLFDPNLSNEDMF